MQVDVKFNNINDCRLEGYIHGIKESSENGRVVISFILKHLSLARIPRNELKDKTVEEIKELEGKRKINYMPMPMVVFNDKVDHLRGQLKEYKWFLVQYKQKYNAKKKSWWGEVIHMMCTEPMTRTVEVEGGMIQEGNK